MSATSASSASTRPATEWYQVTIGGSQGPQAAIGRIIGPSFARDEVPDVIERLIGCYLDPPRLRRRALRRRRAAHRHRAIQGGMSMPRLIQHRRPVANRWRMADTCSDVARAAARGEAGDRAAARVAGAARTARGGRTGARRCDRRTAGTSDDPDVLSGHLHRFALIAVDFPTFTDGRGYSIARQLRERSWLERRADGSRGRPARPVAAA